MVTIRERISTSPSGSPIESSTMAALIQEHRGNIAAAQVIVQLSMDGHASGLWNHELIFCTLLFVYRFRCWMHQLRPHLRRTQRLHTTIACAVDIKVICRNRNPTQL